MLILVVEQLFLDIFLDVIFFPIWWYSTGAAYWGRRIWAFVRGGNERLAPGLWLRNIFVPMYGQYDWQGRLISFFMRVVQVVARSVALSLWCLLGMAFFAVWFIFPIIVARQLAHALQKS